MSFNPIKGGDIAKVGTPVDNQISVWTGDGTSEGTTGFTYDGSILDLTGTIDASVEYLFTERAAHSFTPAATRGILWVRSDTPNILVFTDDAGTDFDLNAASGGGTSISDADSDTQIQVEETADDDKIRFDTGDAITGFPAQANALILSSQEFTLLLPQANANNTAGGAINLTAGQGSSTTYGAGGAANLTGGAGGSTGGDGGAVILTSGSATAGAYRGGDVQLVAGAAFGGQAGGDIDLTSGKGGASGSGGAIAILAGDGGVTSGNGGNITITSGDGDGSSGGGNMTLTAGSAGYGLGGDVAIIGGAGFGSYVGGNVDITAGVGGLVGAGGAVVITGGSGGATGDFGGAVTIKAGAGTAAFVGGNVTLEGGEASTGDEGIVMVRGGFGLEHQALGTITAATDIDPDAGMTAEFTFGAAATAEIGFVSSLETGVSYEMTVEITNGGQGTLTWGAEVEWASGTAPTLTAAGTDLLKFWSRDTGTTWIGWVVALNVS